MRLLTLLLLTCLSSTAVARPVSYPGGWTFITNNSGHQHMGNLHYSPSIHFSIGYQGEYWRAREYQSHYAMLNILVKRWNREDSQANLYIKSGVGLSRADHSSKHKRVTATAFSGIATDWEDRRFFVSYENRFTEPGVHTFFHMHKARVGVAPYVGDYGDLHTWLMVQPEYVSRIKKNWAATFLVRFFKGVDMLELGIDTRAKALVNYIHRF